MPARQVLLLAATAAACHALRAGVRMPACALPRLASSPSMVAEIPKPVDTRPSAPLSPATLSKYAQGKLGVDRVPCASDADKECYALCDAEECSLIGEAEHWDRAKVTLYFGLWYLLSVGYSVTNKRVTNALPLPWTVATATVVVGSVFVSLLWALKLREPPRIPAAAYRTLLPIGTFHAIGHIAGTVGTTAGSVSFAQVVKSAGPVYACVLSALVLRQGVSTRVWMSLLPIVGGVALATVKELSFAWMALAGAVVSDLALALRNVYSKVSMDKPQGENMTPANHFGVLTCISAIVSLPLAFAAEGRVAVAAWRAAAPTGGAALALLGQIALTGLYFYGYSEVAMKALKSVHPVTHAIGNTLRRVVIMLVCMAVFRTPMSTLGAVGSALAIGGSYIYAIVKTQEKARADQAAKEQKTSTTVEESNILAMPLKLESKDLKAH